MANTTLNIPQLGNRFYDYRKDCWGDSYNWSWNRFLDQVQRLVIHHSVTQPTGNWKTETDFVGMLHKNKGWAGYGYHFIIGSDGVVVYVGDLGTARANVANHNEKVIGICLIGDFTKHLPTDIQINSAHDLCDFFINYYPALKGIDGWDKVIGHKDALGLWGNTTATACPGSSWPFDMKDRIKNNIVYTPKPNEGRPPASEETAPAENPPPVDAPSDEMPVLLPDIDSAGFPTGDGSPSADPVQPVPDISGQPVPDGDGNGIPGPSWPEKTPRDYSLTVTSEVIKKAFLAFIGVLKELWKRVIGK